MFLIIKVLTATERFSLERVLSEVIPNKLASGSVFATDNIMFMNRFLSDDEMSALYTLADFYICTSAAEVKNTGPAPASPLAAAPLASSSWPFIFSNAASTTLRGNPYFETIEFIKFDEALLADVAAAAPLLPAP